MGERRKSVRIRTDDEAELRLLFLPSGVRPPRRKVRCRALDISEHGTRLMLLADDYTLNAASGVTTNLLNSAVSSRGKLRVIFRKPHKSFSHIGTVRWVRHENTSRIYSLGFEFTASCPRVMRSWHKYLVKRLGRIPIASSRTDSPC